MGSLTIAIPDERLAKLKEMAQRLGVSPEDLVRASLEDILARPDDALQQALEHVLQKNAELYRRLA